MSNSLRALVAVLALVSSCMSASASDFAKGREAFRSGDFAMALREFRPLAEQGNSDAQFSLGYMYDNGHGVLEDDVEAVRWYRLAAEQGKVYAQFNIGVMYATGKGVLKDVVIAH